MEVMSGLIKDPKGLVSFQPEPNLQDQKVLDVDISPCHPIHKKPESSSGGSGPIPTKPLGSVGHMII